MLRLPDLPAPRRRALGLAAVALGGGGFLPQFAGPGYEAALLAGALLPSVAGVATAVETAGSDAEPATAVRRSLGTGALLAALGAVISIVHGARVGFCDAAEGLAFYALGPGAGAVLGGAWGAVVGVAARRRAGADARWRAAALGLAGPLGGIAVSLWRFHSSPMIFAYDPFFGFFAGTPYDTVIDELEGLVSYRVGSGLTLAALLFWCRRAAMVGGRLVVRPGSPAEVLAGSLLVAGSIAHSWAGPELGHWQTTETVRRALGREVAAERCDVVHSWRVPAWDAALFAKECDAHVVQIEKWLGVRGPERLRVYLFASAAEKGRLMGAADTYVAKPWRAEAYLQAAGFPHPVLGHELVHAVSSSIGRGPFRVAGPLGAWLPDPGRIEGLAVAASPPPDDDLTLQQWARTMRDQELLPRLDVVFRLSFLGEPASRAYTVAGAFVEWLHDTFGADVVARWYGGAELPTLTGRSWSRLEEDWHSSLDSAPVDDRARAVGRARFDRPSVFGRRCPHVVDRLIDEGRVHLGAFDPEGAREAYAAALDLDPSSLAARFGLADCALRRGDVESAAREHRAIAGDDSVHRASRARSEESLGDLALAAGRLDEARRHYEAASRSIVDEDQLRALEVKASAREGIHRDAIVALLVGDPRRGHDFGLAAAHLATWAAEQPEAGLPRYLLGKNLANRGRWREARRELDAALRRELPSPRVLREARATLLVVACAEDDVAEVERVAGLLLSDPDLRAARRRSARRFVERCGATLEALGRDGAQ